MSTRHAHLSACEHIAASDQASIRGVTDGISREGRPGSQGAAADGSKWQTSSPHLNWMTACTAGSPNTCVATACAAKYHILAPLRSMQSITVSEHGFVGAGRHDPPDPLTPSCHFSNSGLSTPRSPGSAAFFSVTTCASHSTLLGKPGRTGEVYEVNKRDAVQRLGSNCSTFEMLCLLSHGKCCGQAHGPYP